MPPRAEVGIDDQVKEIIASRGLTAYAVGKGAGVSHTVIGRWLKGERDITAITLRKIGLWLRVRVVEVGMSKPARKPARKAPPTMPGPTVSGPHAEEQADDPGDT